MDFGGTSEMLDALLQIAVTNVALSGDNAVVMALACRSLPPRQQKLAFLLGSIGVIVLMGILTAFASHLLTLPDRVERGRGTVFANEKPRHAPPFQKQSPERMLRRPAARQGKALPGATARTGTGIASAIAASARMCLARHAPK